MEMPVDLERLRRLLGGADLAVLRRRLRARYERSEWRDVFTLNRLSAAERRALEGLLGRTAKDAGSMRVYASELDEAIARAGLASDLRAALEFLDGPLQDRQAARLALEQTWSAVVSQADEPRLKDLLSGPDGMMLLRRVSAGSPEHAASLLIQARNVLARLPACGISRAQLAAEIFGDSHALDAGRSVVKLILRAASASLSPDIEARPREQWAQLGVAVNELARPVLHLNLPVKSNAVSPTGEPDYLSLRKLLRRSPAWDVAGREIFVCENPEIVGIAADRLAADCAPMVCTDGMPAAAQRTLLAQLANGGARLRYHGDFDWPGVNIGNFVMQAFGAMPWRFGAADYLSACPDDGLELRAEECVEARWDDQLSKAMLAKRMTVHEEAIVATLLADLATSAKTGWQHAID